MEDEKRKAFFLFFFCLAVGGLISQRGGMVQKETKMAVMFVLVGK